MTRVVHTGDTHIGYRQYHSPERRDDFLAAFDRVVEDAIEDEMDAVVHAGDLFHDRRPGLVDLHGTISVLRKLRRADIPFLAIVGNHESTHGQQWLDLFETLGLATRLGPSPVLVGDTAFYGLDHVPVSKRDDLDYEFEAHDADAAALVAHGLFQPFDFGDWDAERVLTEASVDFDAMLLGDNHQSEKERVADAWVTYCGSTERASASERDDRGYNIVHFEEDVTITRRGIPTRDFEYVSVSLAEEDGIDFVREAIREHDVDDAVVLVSIEGEGTDVTPARVEEFATNEGALVARVTDRREIESETEDLSVSFADPDDAVRERVREMGLSETAHAVDEIVRASKVADANVRDAVEEHVSTQISETLAAFEPAEGDDPDAAESDAGDGEAGKTNTETLSVSVRSDGDETGDTDNEDESKESSSENVPAKEPSPQETPPAEAVADSETASEEGSAAVDDSASATDEEADTADTDDAEIDGQISMEDYL
ncbi:DNA double-strand break repair protein Mre11 [Haladaptatus sp. DYF46]|uniref:DNA double-strand break repair protein Mre11 n=1 Tax=Haladaptatus sp. DYF46 TaxID=2886041 RepID=UPI001E45C56A|nr:DNA double-strand break repair protein Mre11 [Haladaptatus sp. DYF46]